MNISFFRNDGTHLDFVEKPQSQGGFPRYAQVLNHVEYTRKMGLKVQNILDFTNVPARFNGIPSVFQQVQTPLNKPISLSPDVQRWMFRLFKECAPAGMSDVDIKKAWRNAFMGSKAFTNKTGWDNNYRDVILEENMNSQDFKLQPTICHGATVKVLREPFAKGGIMQAEIEILDVLDPETLNKTYAENRHLIFPAINWYRYPTPYGMADPFPLLGENDVPIPLLGYGTNKGYINAGWIRYLDASEKIPANPYWGNPNKK